MDEHETAIHWSCVIQEVTKRIDPTGYDTAVEYGAAVVDAAAEMWAWHERVFPQSTPVVTPIRPAPSTQDVPYGDPPPHPGPSSGPPAPHLCGHGPNDTQGCGAELKFFTQGDYSGYECPNRKKTRDPAEQAAEKVRHPTQWINQ